jgi:mono/diheme cytochrome c family protein
MKLKRFLSPIAFSAVALSAAVSGATLDSLGHIHNLVFAGEQQQTLLLGAHRGLYSYQKNRAQRVTQQPFDVMGLVQDPGTGVLFASGHPVQGGNSGLLRSDDGGRHFEPVSQGLNGPVDFHQLAVSAVDPKRIYGVHGGLQRSRDGGNSWTMAGELPPKLLQLAASSTEPERLYVASEQGFFVSQNSGDSWQRLFPEPATSVVTHQGRVFAFIVGKGLIVADESQLQWREIYNAFGLQVLLDLAVSGDGQRLVGLSQRGTLLESTDRGKSWGSLPAKSQPVTDQQKQGLQIYQANCKSCHGIEAVGETYSTEGLTTKGYLFAPALNGSMHGWHHTDQQLVQTILEGSARTSRMPAWKGSLSESDALSTIAYLKTLWGETQKRCQGPGHMDRGCLQGD